MEKHIIPIEEAEPVARKYFSGDENFTTAFMTLAKTTWVMDNRVGVCPRNNIIGVSRADSHFYFYISKSGGNYYIKFKNREEKDFFDIGEIDLFKGYCRDAAIYIITNPGCTLTEQKTLYDPDSFASEDKILGESQELLKSLGDMELPEDLLGSRTYNALVSAGIKTCADLAGKSAQDLLQLEGFGKASLRATCIALLKLAHKDTAEFENEIKIKINPNNDNEALIQIRERTVALVAEQEARPLCDNDESRNAALEFLKDFSIIIENLIKNVQLLTERSTKIICARVFDRRTLADIAGDYDLSRERIRQICQKATRQIKGKISRYKIPDEYADAISSLINDIDDELYLDCMLLVRENDKFLWEVLSYIVADKESRMLLNDFLERSKKISPPAAQDSEPRAERKADNRSNELLEAIEMLQQGIDPETGEILDEESFLFSNKVQKILNIAKAEVLRHGRNI